MTDQTFDDLAFGMGPKLAADIAAAWAWRIAPGWQPVLCAMVGGVFFEDESGVHWLDCLTGMVDRVADDVPGFEARLADDAAAFDEWFLPGLVAQLHAEGKIPEPGQCYGCIIPPVFAEGKLLPDNVVVVAVREVLVGMAEIHRQIAAAPDGTRMRFKIVDD
jgi:hypothetical protein